MTLALAPPPGDGVSVASRLGLSEERLGLAARMLLFVGAIVAAFHLTLAELLETASTDSPLAYVGLVPFVAFAVGLQRARPRPGELQLPHRSIDWIVAVPLFGAAAIIAVVVARTMQYEFWDARIDLLALPFFVGGLVALLFGARVLSRVRWVVLSLFLVWPLPYEEQVGSLLERMAAGTASTLARIAPLMPDVEQVDGTVFTLGSGAESFTVNVAPTCAGASGAIGFMLLAAALQAGIAGQRRRRLLWALAGTVLMLALNIVRLAVLFHVGAAWGETAAIDYLHPYAGLVLFLLGSAAMMTLLPRFGLRWVGASTADAPPLPAHESADDPRRIVGVSVASLAVLAVAVAIMSPANTELRLFDPFRDVHEAAPTIALVDQAPQINGWLGAVDDEIGWARQYFGGESSWFRHRYAPYAGNRTIFVDVITADDTNGFEAFTLEACYKFHSHEVSQRRAVDIGAPAGAETISFENDDAAWAVISWTAPVVHDGERRYERVTALTQLADLDDASHAIEDQLLPFARSLYAAADAGPAADA